MTRNTRKIITSVTAIALFLTSTFLPAQAAQNRSLKLEMTENNQIKLLEMVNCSYEEVVDVLSAMAHVKIEFEKTPSGTITTSLKNLTWREALHIMLSPHLFEVYDKGGGKYIVRKRK
jgi:hypothetical protein